MITKAELNAKEISYQDLVSAFDNRAPLTARKSRVLDRLYEHADGQDIGLDDYCVLHYGFGY